MGGDKGVEIFSANGKDVNTISFTGPAKNIKKVYDKALRGFSFELNTACQASALVCPPDTRDSIGLGLTQPNLVLQMYSPLESQISFELTILDQSTFKRRLHFSSAFKELDTNDLHARIPWRLMPRGIWTNVVIDLAGLIPNLFSEYRYSSIESIILRPICKIRRLFTLPSYIGDIVLPALYSYPVGVESCNYFFTIQPRMDIDSASLVVKGMGRSSVAAKSSGNNLSSGNNQNGSVMSALPTRPNKPGGGEAARHATLRPSYTAGHTKATVTRIPEIVDVDDDAEETKRAVLAVEVAVAASNDFDLPASPPPHRAARPEPSTDTGTGSSAAAVIPSPQQLLSDVLTAHGGALHLLQDHALSASLQWTVQRLAAAQEEYLRVYGLEAYSRNVSHEFN